MLGALTQVGDRSPEGSNRTLPLGKLVAPVGFQFLRAAKPPSGRRGYLGIVV